MSVETRDPIPVGRYWTMLTQTDYLSAAKWAASNAASIAIELTSNEDPGLFVIFQVAAPIARPKDLPDLKLRTASSDIHSYADVLAEEKRDATTAGLLLALLAFLVLRKGKRLF
jgi:hypothetical protein